jgi:hypothetical protein
MSIPMSNRSRLLSANDPAPEQKHRAPSVSRVLSRNGWESATLLMGRIDSQTNHRIAHGREGREAEYRAPFRALPPREKLLTAYVPTILAHRAKR